MQNLEDLSRLLTGMAVAAFLAGCGPVTGTTPQPIEVGSAHDHDHEGQDGHDQDGHNHDHVDCDLEDCDHDDHVDDDDHRQALQHEFGGIGPHGGHLIELGRKHKYHAELTENESTGTVTVYILDTAMKELATGQTTIMLTLESDGQTRAYELSAVSGESAASRFASVDKTLCRTLAEHGGVTGKLRVTIDGIPYVGRIAQRVAAETAR